MTDNKILVFCMLLLVSLPLTAAVASSDASFYLTQNEATTLSLEAFASNNSKATSGIGCTLTMRNPNQQVVISDQGMTFDPAGYFNLTLTEDDVNTLGKHPTTMSCDNGADFGFSTFSIDVTANGFPPRAGTGQNLDLCDLLA